MDNCLGRTRDGAMIKEGIVMSVTCQMYKHMSENVPKQHFCETEKKSMRK